MVEVVSEQVQTPSTVEHELLAVCALGAGDWRLDVAGAVGLAEQATNAFAAMSTSTPANARRTVLFMERSSGRGAEQDALAS